MVEMTPEEEEEIEKLVEFHKEILEGRTLADVIPRDLDLAAALGMSRILLKTAELAAEKMDLDPETIEIFKIGQVIGVGIFLAELGKTRMLAGKKELQ